MNFHVPKHIITFTLARVKKKLRCQLLKGSFKLPGLFCLPVLLSSLQSSFTLQAISALNQVLHSPKEMQTQHFRPNKPHPQQKNPLICSKFSCKVLSFIKTVLRSEPESTQNSRDIHSELERILQPVQQFVCKFTHILLEERPKWRINRDTPRKCSPSLLVSQTHRTQPDWHCCTHPAELCETESCAALDRQ